MRNRSIRLISAMIVASSAATIASPAQANVQTYVGAWNYQAFEQGVPLRVCFNSGFTSAETAALKAGFSYWQTPTSYALFIYGCNPSQIDVKILPIGPASTTQITFSGNVTDFHGTVRPQISHIVITINSNIRTSFYWGTANSSCVVSATGSGCAIDGRTVGMHEFGHALGLGHLSENGWNVNCAPGFSQTSYVSACNTAGESSMNSTAGFDFNQPSWDRGWQGYRHTAIESGSISHLRQLYGP